MDGFFGFLVRVFFPVFLLNSGSGELGQEKKSFYIQKMEYCQLKTALEKKESCHFQGQLEINELDKILKTIGNLENISCIKIKKKIEYGRFCYEISY